MNEASSGWWWWWWRRWWWSVADGLKVGGVVEIGLRGKYLCAPTARNPAQGLVPSGGFRRRRKNAPQGSQPAQSWLSHRLKFAAGKRASHRIAWRIANTFRFLSAVSLSDEKTEHKMEFFRAALFACRVTNQTVPYRAWTLGTSQKNISWQYYTQLTWHWFNTNENNNSQSKGLGPIEANLSGAHTPKHTTLVHILDLTVIHGSTSMIYRFCNRLKCIVAIK